MSALGRCRRCKRGKLRAKVNLFLDIPMERWARLSKTALRAADVKVDGAGWDKALIYCDRCGWSTT